MSQSSSKTCPGCRKNKPAGEFYTRKTGYGQGKAGSSLSTYCKECSREERRERYSNDPAYREYSLEKSRQQDKTAPTVAQTVHKSCEAWRDWLIERGEPTSSPLWRGVMNLMFFSRDNPREVRKLREWSGRVEKEMLKHGYPAA